MSKILMKAEKDKRVLAIILIAVFLAGWISFAYYIYSNQILYVPISGEIVGFPLTTLALRQGQVDNNIKAIILDINSPGGYARSCEEIADYVKELAKVKPVIVVMEDICASGAYYIASFASYIFTHSNTMTGSIGVIAVWVDMSKHYEQEGINITVWITGPEKDLGADWRPPTKDEYDEISLAVDSLFQKMLTDIGENRKGKLTQDALDRVRTGATFSGDEAIELGFADQLGDIIDALEEAIKRTEMWRFIIVSSDMDEIQKFLRALF